MEYVHEGIQKGNQMYAYSTQSITSDKLLKIKNGNSEVVKQGYITKNIDYIFYTSSDLNENYKLYICDKNGNNEKEYTFSFGRPSEGEEEDNNNTTKIFLICLFSILTIILIVVLIIIFRRRCKKKNSENLLSRDSNENNLNN